ncbi:cdp-diacylglycerol--glycerol-3-phosphate 3-phosphatidyltransferase-related [Holotrichia oblita]|uniref:Cdp-diacylglycerol--glycerol-3-phosphate 3-phosphatidyltransferase-related n=1 Tax=Holotrichia oblita TaxID=644536 RepID=A0ACB9TNH4_HOLOL|nr:cdp-diacylglycerol--glycerol-3-phosphate 3-phosphatidyltransferase-related [Holotrichia oblita]
MSSLNYFLLSNRSFKHCQIRTIVDSCLVWKTTNSFIPNKSTILHISCPVYINKWIFKENIHSKYFSTDKVQYQQQSKVTKELKNYFEQNRERFRDTEHKIKLKSHILLKDIKDTKDKVKEKVEEIIERENIYTIPNFLCVSRILVSPYLGVLILQANFHFALVILGVAAATDLLDGWIARTWKSQSSRMGSFLDPMADKVLIGTLFLSLTYAGLIPIALTSIIIGRDVLLIVAGFVIRYQSLPPPRTLSRYFDATHATVQLAPTFISKANTVIQLILVGSTLAAPVFHFVDHPLLHALWYVTLENDI